MKLDIHDICANMQKNCGTDFQNFDFETIGKFFFTLDLVSIAQ